MNNDGIRIIQYLGSKINLLSDIDNCISGELEEGDVLIDLFAGTGVVSEYFKRKYNIISNDIQEYSYLMNLALMNNDIYDIIRKNSIDDLYNSDGYKENFKELSQIFELPLKEEEKILSDNYDEGLIKISESNLFYNNDNYNYNDYVNEIYINCMYVFSDKHLNQYKNDNELFPYCLFSTYYLNGYFSLRQCLEIDSLRYAIDQLSEKEYFNDALKQFYLSCLLHAISEVVSSVGKQFAQPLKLTKNGVKKDFAVRRCYTDKKKYIKYYMENMQEIFLKQFSKTDKISQVYNMDYKCLLNKLSKENQKIDAIYIDPPYTIDHYSRFYHIPETLIKYDYPDLEYRSYKGKKVLMNGRYRNDRFQSQFSIPSKAIIEFEDMIKKTTEFNTKLFLSYSDHDDIKNTRKRSVPKKVLLEILEKYYRDVKVHKLDHEYRKLNKKSSNKEVIEDSELLIICK